MTETNDNNQLLSIGAYILAERSPFSKLLGLEMRSADKGRISLQFPMRDALLTSTDSSVLHGGVIAGSLDMAGGLVVFMNTVDVGTGRPEDQPVDKGKLDTIDLRIDYLRPAKGMYFIAEARILRTSTKLAVTRMYLRDDEQNIVAVGTGTYVIG